MKKIFKTAVVQYRQINAGHACAALSLVAVHKAAKYAAQVPTAP